MTHRRHVFRMLPVILWLAPAFAESVCPIHGEKHDIGAPAAADGAGTIFPSDSVEMLGRVMVAEVTAGVGTANDLWGYVSPSGREYALQGFTTGTGFIEVTDPAAPQVVAFMGHPGGCCSDIKVYQQFAFVVTEGGGGMQIFDLSEIDNGTVTLATTFAPPGLTQAHNLAINEESGFAYICGAHDNVSDGGLYVVDVRVPQVPVFAGAWSTSYVHDVQVVTYNEGPYAGREVAFAFCGGQNQGVRIIDVTDKSQITVLSQFLYPRQKYCHQGWLSQDRRYLYVGDEFDEIWFAIPTTTYVLDVADLANPLYAREFSAGTISTDHNMYVRGEFIYQANYASGLQIFYAPDFISIRRTGFFDTRPSHEDSDFRGAWTAYPYLPSGTVLVSDMDNGLFLLNPEQALARGVPLPVAHNLGAFLAILTALGAVAHRSMRRR